MKFITKLLAAALVLMLLQSVAWSAEPSIKEIYALAESGRVQEAQQLMQGVLRNHPESAKAHFVAAELLAKQANFSAARAELATAERLAPGLPFAARDSVQNLRAQVVGAHSNTQRFSAVPERAPRFSWAPILVGGLVLVIVVMLFRSLRRRAEQQSQNSFGNSPSMPGTSPFNSGMQQPMSGGGFGGGLMGSLATGAALGAGLVAGEAVAHKLMDDEGPRHRPASVPDNVDGNPVDDTMGGNNFGISDSSSWDSGSSDFGGDSGGGWE